MLPITAITPFTMQDFPKHTACIIWFGGCNFRCPYCHNPEFVIEKFETLYEEAVWKFLKSREGLLEGVVLSGGECTLSDEVDEFISKIKEMGFKVKIDTNGLNTKTVQRLVNKGLIDEIGLDYKAPREKFKSISGTKGFDKFEETLNFLIAKNFPFEVRTTVHTDLINEDDINKIISDLEGKGFKTGDYYVQNFVNTKGRTIGNIQDQKRILDINKIIKAKNFSVFFRNF